MASATGKHRIAYLGDTPGNRQYRIRLRLKPGPFGLARMDERVGLASCRGNAHQATIRSGLRGDHHTGLSTVHSYGGSVDNIYNGRN